MIGMKETELNLCGFCTDVLGWKKENTITEFHFLPYSHLNFKTIFDIKKTQESLDTL